MRWAANGILLIILLASGISAIFKTRVSFSAPSTWASLSVDFNQYHNYTEIVGILEGLNATYPAIMDLFSIGRSWQNQPIYCVRLTNESSPSPKPKVMFVGYHHARERISAELPLYFVVYAAENYGTNTTVTHMLDNCEIYVVVAMNPDAFNAVEANEWQRKNVRPFNEDDDGLLDEDPPDDEDGDGYIECLIEWNGTHWNFVRWEGIDGDSDGLLNEDWIGGVDPNRNYGYQWNASVGSGSPNPEDEDFRGPAPFSEFETQAIRDLAMQHDFQYAISFHSGIEYIFYPWGYTNTPSPHDAQFKEIAGNLSSLTGAPYAQSGVGYYTVSGTWDDWMYGNRSTLALTCEIYGNSSAWEYEPGPYPDTVWEKGITQYFNPDPNDIEAEIQRWFPVFSYIITRALERPFPWDVTGDEYVGIDDIVAVAEHFGQAPAHPNWDSKYDITGDDYVGIDDIVAVAEHFGESA